MNEALQPLDPAKRLDSEPASHDMQWVFFGPNGLLRAGWGVLLFAMIFAATDIVLEWCLHPTMHKMALTAGMAPGEANASMPMGFGLVSELLQASGMFVATIALALIERRPVLAYGYEGRARALRFFSGLAYGFLAISGFVVVLWRAGLLSMDGQLLHGLEIWKDAAGWAILFLLVGIFEESTLRGYLQYTLTRGVGFWWGALLFSFLFGFGHGTNPGETPVGLFAAGGVGLVFCLSLWYTGSLWWAVGFHTAWDWGESYFYGTSDSGIVAKEHLLGEHPLGNALWSGGATGPEGSLLVLPFLVLLAVLMWLWWHRRAETPWRGYGWKPAPQQIQADRA